MAKGRRKSPNREEVGSLVREYRRTGDVKLRDRLIAEHLYVVQTVARKFSGLGESHDDLLQEGAMGLVNAVDLYDPDRGVQFSTYATHLVEGHIRHYLRDKGKLIKQPAWVQELTTKIIRARDALLQELDREPSVEEIADRVGTSPENVTRMLEARERSKVASLDAAHSDDEGQPPAVDPEKLSAPTSDEAHLPLEDRIFLRDAMSRLKTLEREVVHHFYYLDLNQTEIARKLGISVNYASYLLRGAVGKLKQAFEAQQAAAESPAQVSDQTRGPSGAYSLSLRPTTRDPATNAATKDHFISRTQQEVVRARRYPQQFSVMVLEPDQDDVAPEELVAIARLLSTNVRGIDLVARLHGPRFGLLLPHTGREAAVLAERLVGLVAGRMAGGERPVTVSVGFAVFPTDGPELEDLISGAEGALAAARREGGNRNLRAQGSTREGQGARPG